MDDRFVRLPEVESTVGLKMSKIYDLIRKGGLSETCASGEVLGLEHDGNPNLDESAACGARGSVMLAYLRQADIDVRLGVDKRSVRRWMRKGLKL